MANDGFANREPARTPVGGSRRRTPRKVRASTAPYAAEGLCPEALAVITRLVGAWDDFGAFTETFLDDLYAVIAWCADEVAKDTSGDYGSNEGWDDDGERTVFTTDPVMTPEARQLSIVLADLRSMASLIERTLDLVSAHAIVVGLRSSGRLATPRSVGR